MNENLKKLYLEPVREHYIKITCLDWVSEAPLQDKNKNDISPIQGLATGGSVSMNGQSTVRRTCNLTLAVPEEEEIQNITDIQNRLSINKKIKVEIGLKDLFGFLPSEPTEDKTPYTVDGIYWKQLGIFIIKTASVSRSSSGLNISLQLSDKMCLLNGEVAGHLPAAAVFSEIDHIDEDGNLTKEYPKVGDIIKSILKEYGHLTDDEILTNKNGDIEDVPLKVDQIMKWGLEQKLYKYLFNGSYFIDTVLPEDDPEIETTYQYHDTVGKIQVDFTWPGQTLTANAGETVTSVLDKIKTLQDYEYFFNAEGKFVWQKKKVYSYGSSSAVNDFLVTSENDLHKEVMPVYNTDLVNENIFENDQLVISYSNAPQYTNIKNDYIVWGKRKTDSGAEIPIRYHLSFDKIPALKEDKTYLCEKYMAVPDAYGYRVVTVGLESNGALYIKSGKGYYKKDYSSKKYKQFEPVSITVHTSSDWRTILYFEGQVNQEYQKYSIYKDLEIEWPKLCDLTKLEDSAGKEVLKVTENSSLDYYCHIIDTTLDSKLNREDLQGYRTKILNENTINCVYTLPVPNIVVQETGTGGATSKDVIQISSYIYNNLYIGGNENSAFEKVRNLICQYTSYANSISITTIPVYEFEPNTLITIEDDKSGISAGSYVINSISVPLTYNGTMSISASRAVVLQ